MPQHHIMYQRKSRQDDPNATVEEVLAKHEALPQDYAVRELGGPIPEENIYREVVSGESINDRIEIKKVLARIEDPQITGVLVVDPQRLSRGDLADCGRLINAFRYTHTQVCTPVMTYDLENKMERKFFQDELLRGRDYLEYTKEILFRGRVAAAKRGCYNGTYAPFGYRKVKIGKDHTLEIVEDDAEVVRLIFDLYTREQLTPFAIAERLNAMGLKPPRADSWKKDTIRHIVRNEHYIGKVRFNKVKSVPMLDNGEVVTKRVTQDDADVILAERVASLEAAIAKLKEPDASPQEKKTAFCGQLSIRSYSRAARRLTSPSRAGRKAKTLIISVCSCGCDPLRRTCT